MRWLGVEIEAFTSTPTIKRQTRSTTHDVAFLPNTSGPNPATCIPEATCQVQRRVGDPAMGESPLTLHDPASQKFKKLRQAVRQLGTSPGDAALHEVRIKTKQARYAAELALWSADKPASRFIKRTRAVQDLLGTYQDALQTEITLRAFLKAATTVRAGFVIGRLVERQRARRETARKRINKSLEMYSTKAGKPGTDRPPTRLASPICRID